MKHNLEVDSIILEFGSKRVLQDIYLRNETGIISGILGRNGSGKSCLLNIVYGTLKTNNKSIRIDKQAVFDGFRYPEKFRFLPQFSFIPKNIRTKQVFKDYNLCFDKFLKYFPEFQKLYTTKAKDLSGGERRIIEIYSILASDTMFCLLDEPFSQVMPMHVDTIKNIMQNEKQKKGIIITDHLYKNVINVSDELNVITFGKSFLIHEEKDLIKLGYINGKKI